MITSINLSTIPFISQTDSTRLQMSSKQVQQSLTSPECDIPFVCSEDYTNLSYNCHMGILYAKHNGKILFNDDDIIILCYDNIEEIKTYKIPPFKKCSANYASKLRFSLKKGTIFKKNNIIYEYDNFLNGIPTFGYNMNTAFIPFFSFNHEDGIAVSETFSNKTKAQYIDRVYVVIQEYTLLQKYYSETQNSFEYFPGVGQKIKEDVICNFFIPKNLQYLKTQNPGSIKSAIKNILKSMNISDLINTENQGTSKLIKNKVKTKIFNGVVNGFKIHRLKKNIKLLDIELQKVLDKLCSTYGQYIMDKFDELKDIFNQDFIHKTMKEHYVYTDNYSKRGNLDLNDAVYLLEFEIIKQDKSYLGDKFANRYAGKGVISCIIPDELRLITKNNIPIDYMTNPFGVFSRMNLGQISEMVISKNVQVSNDIIKSNPDRTKEQIEFLNNNVIKYLNSPKYNERINNIIKQLDDEDFHKRFVEDVQQNNLYVEAPSFSEIDLRNIIKHGINPQEDLYMKKELLEFMEDEMKIKFPFTKKDTIIKNIFCSSMYIQKIYKITSKIIAARDLGNLKSISKQPVRGRAVDGGSKLGYNIWPLHIVMYVE